jgi:putative colanic acid biosysnthesis UDP-glucose lipid carrier transferase
MQQNSFSGLHSARPTAIGSGGNNPLELIESFLEPTVLALAIWAVSIHFEGEVTIPCLIASLLAFSLTFPGKPRLYQSAKRSIADILISWFLIAGLILFFGYATRSLNLFSKEAVLNWLWIGPLAQVSAHLRSCMHFKAHPSAPSSSA